jgi:hypothetical protein
MLEPRPLGLGRGHRSDQHGVIERHPTLALSGPFLDPGDLAAHGFVEEHGAQVSALRQRRAEVLCPRPAEQLDAYADKLSHMLRQETGKSRKQKRTIKQLHADLTSLGYDGSYNRVATFAREWKAARQRELKTCGRGAFVPLAFMPARRFSSTGRKTGPSSAASGPNRRSPTSSSPITAPSFAVPVASIASPAIRNAQRGSFSSPKWAALQARRRGEGGLLRLALALTQVSSGLPPLRRFKCVAVNADRLGSDPAILWHTYRILWTSRFLGG